MKGQLSQEKKKVYQVIKTTNSQKDYEKNLTSLITKETKIKMIDKMNLTKTKNKISSADYIKRLRTQFIEAEKYFQ